MIAQDASVAQLDQAHSSQTCSCAMCSRTVSPLAKPVITRSATSKKNFSWVLRKLTNAAQKCPVRLNLPDTAMFVQGRPTVLLAQSKNGLQPITSSRKLQLNEVLKHFIELVRSRRRVEFIASRSLLDRSSSSQARFNDGQSEVAVVRYHLSDMSEPDEGPTRIFSIKEFTEQLWSRNALEPWRKVAYMQSMFPSKKADQVLYDYFSKPAFSKFLRSQLPRPEKFGKHVAEVDTFEEACRTIAYFVALESGSEIKRMQVEFIEDLHQQHWVSFIRSIETERIAQDKKFRVEKSEQDKQKMREFIAYTAALPKTPRVTRIINVIDSYYERTGINQLLKPLPPEEALIEPLEPVFDRSIATPTFKRRPRARLTVPHRPITPNSRRPWTFQARVKARPASRGSVTPVHKKSAFFASCYVSYD